MKYDRTCSASGMFVANNVMSFMKFGGKVCTTLNNVLQKVTILLLTCQPRIQFYQSHLNNLEEL